VWGLLTVNLLLLVLTHLPVVQRSIGGKASAILSEKLGTQVSVGEVKPSLFNRLVIDDVQLFDQTHREMVRASRLAATINLFSLLHGQLDFSSIQVFGAHVNLTKAHAEAPLNCQFVLDSLASRDTTHTPLHLKVHTLVISRSSFNYDQLDKPHASSTLDPLHLAFSDISAHVGLNLLTDDSLNVNIKRLALKEQSGLTIDKLALKLTAGRQAAQLRDFTLDMPSSRLHSDSLTASYTLRGDSMKLQSTTYNGRISDTHITPSDLRCFLEKLKYFQKSVNIDLAVGGTEEAMAVHALNLYTDASEVRLRASGSISQLQARPQWHSSISELTITDNIIDYLHKNILTLPDVLRRVSLFQANGEMDGDLTGNAVAQVRLNTNVGKADVNLEKKGTHVSGHVATSNLLLGQLLDNSQLNTVDADVHIDGTLMQGAQPSITVDGLVRHIDYGGYTYRNIDVDLTYDKGNVMGKLAVDDPNLTATLEGVLENGRDEKAPKHYSLHGTVGHLATQTLHLTDKWGDARLSANIEADFTGHALNDAQGSLRLANVVFTQPEKPDYRLDNLLLTTGFEEHLHYMTLVSDFAKAELRGSFDYNTLTQSITNFVGSRLPTLPGLPPVSNKTDNDFLLRLQLYKTDWLQLLAGTDFTISHPVTLDARVCDPLRTINVNASLPAFTYNGSPYADAEIHITTPLDTMRCNVSLEKIMDDGLRLHLGVDANAADNNLNTSLSWDNGATTGRMSGQLNSITQLYRNQWEKPEAHVRVMPSHLIVNDTTWMVEPSDILYSANHLLVDRFTIHNRGQHIIIDGMASDSPLDALTVDLNEVEVGYILDLVNFHVVAFSGKATGQARLSSLFGGTLQAGARLDVTDFKFERGRMGTLHAQVDWNNELKQLDIRALADDGPEAQTDISGYVSPERNWLELNFGARGTYVDFMHSFTESFLSSITGHANGQLQLGGSLDALNLTGKLAIEGEATITALNTTYQLQRDTVVFIPNEIRLGNLRLTDKYGNSGVLTGTLTHQDLTRLGFDLNVRADNLLAYDFSDFGGSNFYGHVLASGNVDLHGRPGEVVINCNVTPQSGTTFTYNASSPDEISSQEFIEWGSANNSGSKPAKASVTSDEEDVDIPTDIYINFLVNCTPESTMRLLMDQNTNDYITLNGDGTIRATFYNKGPFNMFGTYTVDHGTYGVTIQNIIKKNFTFTPGGTIVFGGDPYNAALNLQAVYTVNGVSLSDLNIGNSFASNTIRVNCLMNIGGQPNAPQVDFDLEMPTVNADEQQMVRSVINGQQEMNQQVLYLLGIGRFYNQGNNNSGTEQGSDQTSLAMQSFLSGTLSTQINSLLSTVIKNDNWNFGANISTGNEGWHNAEYEGLISGRMLNNRLLLNGQFGYRDNAKQASPSFIGDFDIQYLLFPNGNLSLKVYNQTNDRYFTKSSLNTQGIGLIMKKDFNGLRDLFSTKKRRKKMQPEPSAAPKSTDNAASASTKEE
nr:translocation/assembly module TamB [Prevotella sp.]